VRNPNAKVMTKREFVDGYVDARFPNLTGYAYQSEILTEEKARTVMYEIVKRIDWIEERESGHPILHMRDGKELFVDDTDDFPKPTDEENI
jgi:hypothetical protein